MLARWMAAMAIAAVFAVAPAHADAVADFYRGKQIDLIIGYGPSGGYDVYARLLARHFGKFIPGNPSVVAQNMPGGGSLRAVNYLYNLAPRDGTVIATAECSPDGAGASIWSCCCRIRRIAAASLRSRGGSSASARILAGFP